MQVTAFRRVPAFASFLVSSDVSLWNVSTTRTRLLACLGYPAPQPLLP